ncbi:MAG: SusC/RagA family TonB-linked outer membrane protein [Chitinophagaceae bacterium]|nr:SusC/RagA family TonB-linked outer membrane protein [Chitinophagaceae bacterium]
MRRFLSLFTMLMLCGVLAFAQSRVVTGKVTDIDGNPVSFASVKIKGSSTGVSADANGAYSLRVNTNDVLVISGASFTETEVPVGTQNVLNTVLEKSTSGDLKEVVVTSAFGIRRTGRSTASNVQNLTGDQVNTIRQTNVNNALAGKVAGAQVRSQSVAKLGAETTVRLRGENGFGVGGGALYVVDGTIMPSGADINPDDVEDYSVLQGPAAAALFGPDGSNGAIVITLKKAKKGAKGIGLELNAGIQFDKVYIVPDYQNSYAGGASYDLYKYAWKPGQPEAWKALDGKYYHDYSDDASWGPRLAGQEYIPWYAWYPGHEYSFKTAKLTPQPTNVRDFWETGVTRTTNVAFSKATDNLNMRVSYTNLDIKGITPNEYLKRHTLNANLTAELSSRFTLGVNFNYIAENRNTESDDGYSNQTTGTFGQWFHRDLDISKMRELRSITSPEGVFASWNKNNPDAFTPGNPAKSWGGNYWFNPYQYFDNINNSNRRDRIFGDVSLTYKINNDFKVKATYRKQQLTVNSEAIYKSALQSSANQMSFNPWEGNAFAGYGVNNSFSDRQNYEGLLSYSKKYKSFQFNANGGFDILKTTFRGVNANTVGGLSAPNLYALANSKNPINYGNTRQNFIRRGLFVRADIGFRNFLFVEGSYRRDYTSTEPKDNYIDSKSGGLSFVFSDLIRNTVPFISYGKIRGSIGQLLNTLGIGQLNALYTINPQQYNGNILTSAPNNLVDPALQGATNVEKELGLEMRFMKNRFGFNVTYWDRTNKDFPVNVTVTGTTGYTAVSRNAGELAKQGWDVTAFVKPIQSKNFDWDISGTWGYLTKNEVVSIFPGINRLVLSSGAFSTSFAAYSVNQVGSQWGEMFGGGIKKVNGVPELTSNGLYVREADVNFGSVLPQYTGGVQNTFNIFKNFTVNVNIDYSYGGKFFSLSDFWGTFSGLTARTAGTNDIGNPVRNPVELDGSGNPLPHSGGVHVFGVDNTGKAVDYYVDAQTYYHQFQGRVIAENSIYDLTFVKLRELSIGYKVPVEKLGIGRYVKTAIFSVVSRNPWLIYSKTKGFDPSEISNVYGEDGQLPGTRSVGVNLKLGF